MKALQYRAIGSRPELVEVETPEPAAGEVRLRVTAAGACHSDEFIMSTPADQYYFHPLPLTLGHEVAGTVDSLGEGTSGVAVGDPVLVYGPWGCGRCHACSRGEENNCEHGTKAPGIFSQGGMAEYMIVDDVRHLVPLEGLDPVAAVSLSDAGLTPYHAIKPSVPKLVPGSTAVVIGVGGLGHVAIQILKALTAARVVALDIDDQSLELAKAVGAHEVLRSDAEAANRIKEMTGGRGATVVFDFVGARPTADLARSAIGIGSEIVIVGVGQGSIAVGYLTVPFDVSVRVVNWGTRSELLEVLELARDGAVRVEVERYPFDQAPEAYAKLHAGQVRGRAIVLPTE